MTPETEKFLFNRSFDTPRLEKKDIKPELEEPFEPEIQAPTFSENDLNAARNEGFEKGKLEGLAEFNESLEGQLVTTIEKAIKELHSVKMKLDNEIKNNLESAIRTSTTILKKIFPILARDHGTQEIEAILKKILSDLKGESNLSIKVNPELKNVFDAKIKKMIDDNNSCPNLELHEDTNILLGDCQVIWDSGTAERNSKEVWRQIDEIIETNFPKQTSDINLLPGSPIAPKDEKILNLEESSIPISKQNKTEIDNEAEAELVKNDTSNKLKENKNDRPSKIEKKIESSEQKQPYLPNTNVNEGVELNTEISSSN